MIQRTGHHIPDHDPKQTGGKADNLLRLSVMDAGFRVPRFNIISATVFNDHTASLSRVFTPFLEGEPEAAATLSQHALQGELPPARLDLPFILRSFRRIATSKPK